LCFAVTVRARVSGNSVFGQTYFRASVVDPYGTDPHLLVDESSLAGGRFASFPVDFLLLLFEATRQR